MKRSVETSPGLVSAAIVGYRGSFGERKGESRCDILAKPVVAAQSLSLSHSALELDDNAGVGLGGVC